MFTSRQKRYKGISKMITKTTNTIYANSKTVNDNDWSLINMIRNSTNQTQALEIAITIIRLHLKQI